MMRILAIDTSVGSGSVAAADGEGVAERPLGPPGSHARVLTSALAEVATSRGWCTATSPLTALGPTDVVAVVRGPGSFTGLRVGVTAAKALSWTTGARLVGVSGFEVVARRTAGTTGCGDGPIAVAYDAGRGDVFVATLTPSPTGWTMSPPALIAAESWLESLPPGSRLSGPGIDGLATRLDARSDLWVAAPDARYPSAADVAAIARERAEAGLFDDPITLVPDYLRPSYAEEKKAASGG